MPLSLAIIGRPNVGKSTFFNRLAGKSLAIVHDMPGVTRDWREAEGDLYDLPLRLIDTAGLEEAKGESLEGRMRAQTENAIARADAVLFLVDARAGITPLDEHFAALMRKQSKPVILVLNKCENEKVIANVLGEAYALGLGEPVPVSAAHGEGMELLYDILQDHVETAPDEADEPMDEQDVRDRFEIGERALDSLEMDENFDFAALEDVADSEAGDPAKPVKVAIVGRPNAGKSTLLNALIEQERVLTSPEAGTTRDSIAVDWTYGERHFRLVDTAGLRKKAKINDNLEKMAVDDTLRAIRLAQIVVLVVDANMMMDRQDLAIARHVVDEGRVLVLAVNKWDTIRDKKDKLADLSYALDRFAQLKNPPFVTISALKGRNLDKLMQACLAGYDLWTKRVSTGKLNRWLGGMTAHHPPPLVHGRNNRMRYITQVKTRPPTFVIWASYPKAVGEGYRRYLINGLAREFGLEGVPIRLIVRTSKNPYV